MTLEEFKNYGGTLLKERMMRSDIIDFDNGTMTVFSENISKYLEKYSCKNTDDLSDALWYGYGIFLKIID